MEDGYIISQLFERNEEAIQFLNEKYEHYLFTIANNILRNNEDSEEVVNDTFLAAWESIPPNRPDILSLYLAKITRHISIDKVRKKFSKKRIPPDTILPLDELQECKVGLDMIEQQMNLKALGELMNQFLEKRKKEHRILFIMRYWYSMSIKEICEKTGYSESKVKNILLRERKELKKYLEREGVLG
jgi:RNA polymerase sigma-70 factor (ECF subfamily)